MRLKVMITGDRVTLGPGRPDRVHVEPGAGRTGTTFLVRNLAGHVRVLPSDALPLLTAGRVDPRLFDVTTLLHHPDSAAGPTRTLTVEVSYDDGAHWFAATVTCQGDEAVARWAPPAGHGFISLRATAADAAGNTVEETLIRAYRF